MRRRWNTREELIYQTVQMAASRRAIARALGVSRNTVRGILEQHAQQREQPHIGGCQLFRVRSLRFDPLSALRLQGDGFSAPPYLLPKDTAHSTQVSASSKPNES